MGKIINIFAPATVANLGPGFDILGLALNDVGDFIEMELTHDKRITIEMENLPELPTDPKINAAGVALQALLSELKSEQGFSIKIRKNVRPGSGLGSSASSSAGAVFAANELLGKPFTKHQLVEFAMQGEGAVSGKPHADNVAPSLLGGITLVRSYNPLDIVNLTYPEDLRIVVVHPQIEIKTSESKKMLRKEITMEKAIQQWGNVAGLVAGLAQKDYDLIGRSLEDVIVEPTRSILIPEFASLKTHAMEAGALGCSISGSGPSVFALTNSEITAQKIKDTFEQILDKINIVHNTYISSINKIGATIV